MKDLLEHLARRLVDDPSAVRVEEVVDDDAYVLLLHVAAGDRGKVIGRQGRTVRALRTLARASGGGAGRRIHVEIAE